MAAGLFKKVGYGQVEPNHLSAQRNGEVYAQLPAEDNAEIIENGMFLKYDREDGHVNAKASSYCEWCLVYNEVKNYDNEKQGYKDFALKKAELLGTNGPSQWKQSYLTGKTGAITPRLFGMHNGDSFTTNLVYCDDDTQLPAKGDYLGIRIHTKTCADGVTTYTVGVLEQKSDIEDITGPVYQVVKQTTLPDGQPAIKVAKITDRLAVEDDADIG